MPTLIPLSRDSILAALGDMPVDLRLYDIVDSTNTEARRLVEAAEDLRTSTMLLAARTQTAGRGRMGRSFYSPPDSGLYMTLVYPLTRPLNQAVAVTAGAAVATCRAISDICGLHPGIKWVNDLYLGGKKICGILAEAATPMDGLGYMRVGIGINLTTGAFPAGLRALAGCLSEFLPAETVLDAGRLCGSVAAHLLSLIQTDSLSAPETLATYRENSLLIGKQVLCTHGNTRFPALAMAITDDYCLQILRPNSPPEILESGEVSVALEEE